MGYRNVIGFDKQGVLSIDAAGSIVQTHSQTLGLPFDDATFDFVFSEQVFEHVQDQALWWRELYRVMRPGALGIHTFPARWRLVESHTYVPLGGVFGSKTWLTLWALAGIRNDYQRKMSWHEVVDHNLTYAASSTRYLRLAELESLWKSIGYELTWQSRLTGGRLEGAEFPDPLRSIIFGAYRRLHSRRAILRKPT